MNLLWLKSIIGVALFLLFSVVILTLFFDKSHYTQEEIDWCKANRPYVLMDICANEFGFWRKSETQTCCKYPPEKLLDTYQPVSTKLNCTCHSRTQHNNQWSLVWVPLCYKQRVITLQKTLRFTYLPNSIPTFVKVFIFKDFNSG